MLYLYTKGYRKFLFFVNQTNVLEKTIDNFTNTLSSKYLFDDTIEHLSE
ncbi:DEAD/DEAH box helicase family protein [Mycoplasmopsis cynos]|nr:DEAD/DEAH box helicase family protein [Mycoplasmopsis cynos]UWV83387.1 DEAD/DEAH box helicase family protein [Mycoplasmopsis cynos]